jgi:SAM-dependent methyltransferase
MTLPSDKYITNDYLNHNPSWDIEDSAWKAEFVVNILNSVEFRPGSICDVGCGAGVVLAALRGSYPDADLFGFDVAPDAAQFWSQHRDLNILFQVGDFLTLNTRKYDVILGLDVVEHLTDPFSFLDNLRKFSTYYLFHFPLDLSAINVIREGPILKVREKVGHIHYFTKNLALSLLKECGYNIVKWSYSGATFNSPQRSLKTILASIPRRFAHILSKDLGVRILGGETLFVLARDKNCVDR